MRVQRGSKRGGSSKLIECSNDHNDDSDSSDAPDLIECSSDDDSDSTYDGDSDSSDDSDEDDEPLVKRRALASVQQPPPLFRSELIPDEPDLNPVSSDDSDEDDEPLVKRRPKQHKPVKRRPKQHKPVKRLPKHDTKERKPKWVQIASGPFTEADNFCADLRLLQQRSGCTDKTCEDIAQTFSKYFGGCAQLNFKSYDKKMQKVAGAKMLRLNGCPDCKQHVFLPSDKSISCPICGSDRFKADGKPKEQVYYFPLKSKLKALFRTPGYKRMLQHEFFRPRNEDLMSDVYDAPSWKNFMGEVTYPNNRIGE